MDFLFKNIIFYYSMWFFIAAVSSPGQFLFFNYFRYFFYQLKALSLRIYFHNSINLFIHSIKNYNWVIMNIRHYPHLHGCIFLLNNWILSVLLTKIILKLSALERYKKYSKRLKNKKSYWIKNKFDTETLAMKHPSIPYLIPLYLHFQK